MRQFTLTILLAAAMLCAIPLAPICAVSPHTPLYTHFIYMFAHANLLHWLVNSWAMLFIHRLFTPMRLTAAYLTAVAISFVTWHTTPTLGFSVILFFFIGYILYPCWRRKNNTILAQTALFIGIGFLLPSMAASYHLLALVAGIIYYQAEHIILDISSFNTP